MSTFPNEAFPHYTPGQSQLIQQAPYPGQNQEPYPGPQQEPYSGPQQGPYPPGAAPFSGQDYYGGQQPPPGGEMYPPQQGAYFTGKEAPPPGEYAQDRPKKEGPRDVCLENCIENCCVCLVGCFCTIITRILCGICEVL